MHTFNSPLVSTAPPAIVPLCPPWPRLQSSAYSDTLSTNTLPQATCPPPRGSSLQALDRTPAPVSLYQRGRESSDAQLVRCPPRQNGGGILGVPLFGAVN